MAAPPDTRQARLRDCLHSRRSAHYLDRVGRGQRRRRGRAGERRLRDEGGQTAAEYVGIIVLVAAIIAALAATGVAGTIGGGIEDGVCAIVGSCDQEGGTETGDDPGATTVDPQLTSGERTELLGDPQDAQDVLASLSPEERAWIEQNDPELAGGLAAALDWQGSEELVSRYAEAPLGDYLDYRDSSDRDDRLDYTTDECSAPMVGNTGISFDFTDACLRHDFGYRNYKELGLFDERKSDVDRRFLEDMKDHCASRSIFLQPRCYDWAYTFYGGVVALG